MENFERNNEIQETGKDIFEEHIEEPQSTVSRWKSELWDWIKAIAIALVIALFLKNYVLTLAKVQGESMEPTLNDSDRLYVNKLFYTPENGDIVIVESNDPLAPFYIKRVIAKEGDTIFINFSSGEVFVNDEVIEEPYIADKTHLVGSYIYSLMLNDEFSRETPLVLGENEYFVMGDNRNNSKDSREMGIIKKDEIIGHAVFRFWPLNKMGNLDYSFEE